MANKEYGISFAINGLISNAFQKTFKKANQTVGTLSDHIAELNKKSGKIERIVRLRETTKQLTKELHKEKSALADIEDKIAKSKSPTAGMLKRQAQMAKQVEKTSGALGKQMQTLQRLHKEMKAGGKSAAALQKYQQTTAASIERAQQKQQLAIAKDGRRASLKGLGSLAMSAAGAFATVGLKGAIMSGADAQKSLSRVYAADPNLTDDQKKRIEEETRRISIETGRDFNIVAEGFRSFLTAGFSLEEAIKSMPHTLAMAAAADIKDFDQAAQIQSVILKSYGLGADKSGMVADLATNAALAGFMDLPFIGDVAKIAGKKASDARMSLGELGAMAVSLSDTGASGTEAGTSVRNILSRLTAPNAKAAQMFKAMEFNPLDAKGQIRPIVTLLAELQEKMDKYGLNEGERAKLLKTVFEEATMDHAKLLIEQAASGKLQASASMLGTRGTAQRVASIQENNLLGDAKILGSAFEDLKRQLFNPIEEPLRDLTQSTTKLVNLLSGFLKDNPALAAGATGILGTAAAGGTAMASIGILKKLLPLLGFGGASTGAGGAVMAAAKATPWGRIIGIGAAIVGAYLALRAGQADTSHVAAMRKNPEALKGIPEFAKGGIVTGPTLAMVGEGSESEAILPLSRLSEMVGGYGGGDVTVHFAPTITISGNGDAYADVKRGIAEGSANLKRELERLLADQRRLSFV